MAALAVPVALLLSATVARQVRAEAAAVAAAAPISLE
jgi:hypothetical protein